ncbi:hypothetical protein GJ496_002430 [Pomphorhynchus laevis]|nr:hypothetical protein GJ496_002430 [Pomphorhynchus laevis]
MATMQEKVIELLNNASLYDKESMRLNHFKQIHDIVIHKEPNLLDNFLDEMLAFQNDRSSEVRKAVIIFIEEACRHDSEVIVKVIENLRYLLYDENASVAKRAIGATAAIYTHTLKWMARLRTISANAQKTWETLQELKDFILLQMNSENDGIKIATIRFLQALTIVLSFKPNNDPTHEDEQDSDCLLDIIPEQHRLLDRDSLADEGQEMFKSLMTCTLSQRISSNNLIACMICLADICKVHPSQLANVIQAFETLQVNLPPVLSKSEVLSVRKQLKLQLLYLLKVCSSESYRTNIATLLTDLGATRLEVMRYIPDNIITPKPQEKRKSINSEESFSKRSKINNDELNNEKLYMPPGLISATQSPGDNCIDITASDIVNRLTHTNVADIVLLSMMTLPDTMPASFQSAYTPIAGAGTTAQIHHLARLLATQMTGACLGKGYEQVKHQILASEIEKRKQIDSKPIETKPISSLVGVGRTDSIIPQESLAQIPNVQSVKKPRVLKLSDMVKPLTYDQMNNMTTSAFRRILNAEDVANTFGQSGARRKVITSLITMSGKSFRDMYEDYIFADFKKRGHLAIDWLYQEYDLMMGFLSCSQDDSEDVLIKKRRSRDTSRYDDALSRILESLQEKPDQQGSAFSKVLLVAPYLTDNSLQTLKKNCVEYSRTNIGMHTLRDLIKYREPLRERCFPKLLAFTHSDNADIRLSSVKVAKELYSNPKMKNIIEKYALQLARYLHLPNPPAELFAEGASVSDEWTDDAVKMSLLLLLFLMTHNHALIHPLTSIYTAASGDVKRSILKMIESPIRSMGINSPQLLELVEICPKGAETMITRIIHILTDKSVPSQDLVNKIRDLYEKRIPDVRFLIPVLGGLHKNEIIPVLPKLIKLTPAVVKEVFNRLLYVEESLMPIGPVDLLIALHQIPSSECDLKSVIAATGHCFAERNIFNQHVLENVISTLVEMDPLPVISMRTILQSIAIHPKITAFVVKILDGLIAKEIWNMPLIWQGFVKCCQRTRPHCYPMLINLPTYQLIQIITEYAELKHDMSILSAGISSLNPKAEYVRAQQSMAINFSAAKGLMEVLRTSFGPSGTYKMLVSGAGEIKISKDGNVLLGEMQIQHPTASLIARAATAQDKSTGDGTISIVLLIGELLKQAELYIAEGLHPRVLHSGLHSIKQQLAEIVDELKVEIPLNGQSFRAVVGSSLSTKLSKKTADYFTSIIVDAIMSVRVENEKDVDLNMIEIIDMMHQGEMESRLIKGIVLDHGARHPDMPHRAVNAYILTCNVSMEFEKTEVNSEFFYKSAEDREKLVSSERKFILDRVQKVVDLKNKLCPPDSDKSFVLINQKGIDPFSLDLLARNNIMALRRAKRRNMERLTKACGGIALNSFEQLDESHLGYAGEVYEHVLGEDKFTFVEGCKNPKSVTILVKGPSKHTITQIKDALDDGLMAANNLIQDGCILPGAGAFEIACSAKLLKYKESVRGRNRLAVQSFADALLIIPKILASNAGLDPQEVVVKLQEEYSKSGVPVGLDLKTGCPINPLDFGIYDGYSVKKNILNSAHAIASSLLLVDEILRAGISLRGSGGIER